MTEADAAACRADVWLWRARFFKTRALACRAVEAGRVRVTRSGVEARLDKPSRLLRPGDVVVFALAGRLVSVRYAAPGDRRGPAAEARTLYTDLAAAAEPPGTRPAAPEVDAPDRRA